jgi:hypothetical protein
MFAHSKGDRILSMAAVVGAIAFLGLDDHSTKQSNRLWVSQFWNEMVGADHIRPVFSPSL